MLKLVPFESQRQASKQQNPCKDNIVFVVKMCRKCFRVPTLLVIGVLVLIVLVLIIGVTLTNTINVHNIIKLNEKVVSDSVANSQESKETRDIYMTRHPKNLNKTVIIRLEVDNTSAKYDRLIASSSDVVEVDVVDLLTTVSTIDYGAIEQREEAASTTTVMMKNNVSSSEADVSQVGLSIAEKNYTLIDNEKREHVKQVSLFFCNPFFLVSMTFLEL